MTNDNKAEIETLYTTMGTLLSAEAECLKNEVVRAYKDHGEVVLIYHEGLPVEEDLRAYKKVADHLADVKNRLFALYDTDETFNDLPF